MCHGFGLEHSAAGVGRKHINSPEGWTHPPPLLFNSAPLDRVAVSPFTQAEHLFRPEVVSRQI